MAPLRERREWRDAAENMKGSISRKTLVGIRSEQKAPFRLFRLILSSGLGASALVGLIIIITRLISSLKGSPHCIGQITELIRQLQKFSKACLFSNSKVWRLLLHMKTDILASAASDDLSKD